MKIDVKDVTRENLYTWLTQCDRKRKREKVYDKARYYLVLGCITLVFFLMILSILV